MSEYLENVLDGFEPTEHMVTDSKPINDLVAENGGDINSIDGLVEEKTQKQKKQTGGARLTDKILHELHALSVNARNSIEDVKKSKEENWNTEHKDDINLFFTFTGQVHEYLLREAVILKVIADNVVSESIRRKVHGVQNNRGFSFTQCIELLNRGGVMDDGLKGEIMQARTERNEVVHEITRWLFGSFNLGDIESTVSRAERSTVRLLEIVYDFDLE